MQVFGVFSPNLGGFWLLAREIRPISDRFYEKVMAEPNSGCWLWTGCVKNTGYGRIQVGRRCVLAHRVSYELHRDPIPPGMHVLHRCDQPGCVNPNHLFLGTHLDNMADREAKGRNNPVRGEAQGTAKLTEADVRKIRAASGKQRDIAKEFGITQANVWSIRARKTWAHAT